MFSLIAEMFSYDFMVRALFVGVLVSLCSALLGVTLVLKRFSMIGDGLSHVGFGVLAAAMVLNVSPLALSIPVVMAAAVLLLRISAGSEIKGDAATALIASSALAVGVIIASLSTGMNSDVCGYMFGSILAMSTSDVILSVVLSAAVLVMYILFYNKIFAVAFDENFARASGVRVDTYNTLTALLTAITIVLGMRMMGALLISSLIIFPALTAMRVFRSFISVTICAAILSVSSFLVGMLISFAYAIPAGASIVVVSLGVFCAFWLFGRAMRAGVA